MGYAKRLTKEMLESFGIGDISLDDELTMRTGNIRKPCDNGRYLIFPIYVKQIKKGTNLPYHRMKWAWFYGEVEEGYVVDHINEDKHDNRLENLQLLTPAQNLEKSRKIKERDHQNIPTDYIVMPSKKQYTEEYLDAKIAEWKAKCDELIQQRTRENYDELEPKIKKLQITLCHWRKRKKQWLKMLETRYETSYNMDEDKEKS